jgi:O-antigen/teichoic acid export membrane protein
MRNISTVAYKHQFFVFWMANLMGVASGMIFTLIANAQLDLESMGTLGLYTNTVMMVSVFSVTIGITANRFAVENRKRDLIVDTNLLRSLQWLGTYIGLTVSILYIASYLYWGSFFQVQMSLFLLVTSALLFIVMMQLSWLRGMLQAKMMLLYVSFSIVTEAIVKVGIGLLGWNFNPNTAWFILGMNLAAITAFFVLKRYNTERQVFTLKPTSLRYIKPHIAFIRQALVQRFGVIGLVTIDVILAKHFLEPEAAGVYVLLSIVGKMIFFLTQSFYTLMVPVLSAQNNRSKRFKEFFKIVLAAVLTSLGALWLMMILPKYTLELFMGYRYQLIEQYVVEYAIAILLISVSTMVALYLLLHLRYISNVIIYGGLCVLVILIGLNHSTIAEIVQAVVDAALVMFMIAVVCTAFTSEHLRSFLKKT